MKIIKYSIVLSLLFIASSYAQDKYTGNVGIGTDNPKNNLDIRGDLRLIPDSFEEGGNYSPLFRVKNGNEGAHKIVKKGNIGNVPENEKQFLKFDLIVKLDSPGKDYCKFDTKIPAKDYDLVIINSELEDNMGEPAAISHISYEQAKQGGNGYAIHNSPKQVLLTKSESDTWVISADFPRTTAITKTPGDKTQWFFSLIAIPSKQADFLNPKPANRTNSLRHNEFKLNEAMSASASSNPIK